MAVSIFFNKKMYILKEDGTINRVPEDKPEECYGTKCLILSSDTSNSDRKYLLGRYRNTKDIDDELKDLYGAYIHKILKDDSGVKCFAIQKVFAKTIFDIYRVKEIYPFDYIFKDVVKSDGSIGILSQDLLMFTKYDENTEIFTNEQVVKERGVPISRYFLTREGLTIDALNDHLATSSDVANGRAVIINGIGNQLRHNIATIDRNEIEALLTDCPLFLTDNVSDLFKRKDIRKKLTAVMILFGLIGGFCGVSYINNKVQVISLQNKIKQHTAERNKLTKQISTLKNELPDIKFTNFNYNEIVDMLEELVRFNPQKLRYNFKDDKSVEAIFYIKDYKETAKLINFLNEKHIDYDYSKGSGYGFDFNVRMNLEEKE